MASQLSVVGGNKRLRRNQTAELNARQALLPQIIANKQRAEDLGRAEEMKNIQISQFNRQHSLNLQSQAAQRRAGEVGMGLEAAKLGMTVKDRFGGGKSPLFAGKKAGGFMNKMKFGEAVGGGLAGFGAAKMLGGKSKIKKALVGSGVGAALGFLGGGGGGGALSGGFGGALGGLFG